MNKLEEERKEYEKLFEEEREIYKKLNNEIKYITLAN